MRLKLAGFSYFGEIGGHRHIPLDPVPLLYPDRNTPNWQAVIEPTDNAVRATYAQWLALLKDHKVNLVRVWAFDLNEADSYPFFHTFNSEQYNLEVPSMRYQRRLLRFIEIARQYGIIVHLTLASDQMMRPGNWDFMPFHPDHALPSSSGTEFFTTDGFQSFLGITGSTEAAVNRRRILKDMVTSLVKAVKPFWNVMFEIMNEAGVRDVGRPLLPAWHREVASWLDAELKEAGTGERTHLVTTSAVPEVRAAIMNALVVNGRNLVDIVSLHGNSWGGPDGMQGSDVRPEDIEEIKADTRLKVKELYEDYPDRAFAVICDSDAFPWAQEDPELYAASAFQLQLNDAHRWHERFITQRQLLDQLDQLKSAIELEIPENTLYPDSGGRPISQYPAVSPQEAAVAGSWVHRRGIAATDIGIFRRDSVWVVSNTPTDGGFTIHRWNGSGWSPIDRGAMRISVGPNGLPWIVNDLGQIYQRTLSGWVNVPGATASDIGVGGDGSVWIIGTEPAVGGFQIKRLVDGRWVTVDGGGMRIAVNPVGEPWVVNDANNIFARDGNRWLVLLNGKAVDIAVGIDDTCWSLSTTPAGGGTSIQYWVDTEWRPVSGGGTSIAVD